MRRRDLIALLGSAAALPVAARAQPANLQRVGILSDESASLAAITFRPFSQRLRELGYVEGQNIAFERRYAGGDSEALSSFAAELVRLHPDVIFAVGTPAAQAAKSATQTIPIVFARTGDPVGSGLVAALARPGANLTGMSILTKETGAKRLEFQLQRAVGTLTHSVYAVMADIVSASDEYQLLRQSQKDAFTKLRSVKLALRAVTAGLHGYQPAHLMDEAFLSEPVTERRSGFAVDEDLVGAWAESLAALEQDADTDLPLFG
jgi:putative ABC transport system substrate-binding protein